MLGIVITLIVIGVLLWLVDTYVPMNTTIKRILIGVVIFAVVLWLLSVFGLLGSLNNVQVPRVNG